MEYMFHKVWFFFIFFWKYNLSLYFGVIMMQVERVINNNVVSAYDKGKEVLIMGKGVGFQAKKGKEVDQKLIEKIFYLETQTEVDRFKDLLTNLPLEHIQLSNEIITYADKVLNRKLNPNVYITLTDHINFAIERYHQGMIFDNPLLWDVQRLYRQEYLIGEYAVALIEQRIKLQLPVDEAASIALHIVNAEYNNRMSETMSITRMIPQLVHIVETVFGVIQEEHSLQYGRFVTELKNLIQRIMNREQEDNIDQKFKDMVKELYPEEYACSEKIIEHLKDYFPEGNAKEEQAMLSIQIRRFILGSRAME
ncbi:MAG: transcriptional antiterminator, BglG family [Herbinix sp.]|jgi:beta-glucoside operon transcriptional antiterminator|nr:transcriptional antiterminator, BglG family [Herbinix sp.]